MLEENFKKKNEIGIEIEYSKIGTYTDEEGRKYRIYTNFIPTNNEYGIRLYVDEELGKDNYKPIDSKKAEEIIAKFTSEAENYIIENNLIDNKKQDSIKSEKNTESTEKKDKLQILKNDLQKAIENNEAKKVTKIRGRIINELKKRIKKAPEEEKEKLKAELSETLEKHKYQINSRYEKEYKEEKKTFKAIVTVLPKGIALSFKQMAATIEELRLSKTGKEKIFKSLEATKDTLQATIGTPVDFTVRFAINHWYLLLLLLGLKWKSKKTDLNLFNKPKPKPTQTPEEVLEPSPANETENSLATSPVKENVPGLSVDEQRQEQLQFNHEQSINQKPAIETPPIQKPSQTNVNSSSLTTESERQEKVDFNRNQHPVTSHEAEMNAMQNESSTGNIYGFNHLEELTAEEREMSDRLTDSFVKNLEEHYNFVIGDNHNDIFVVHNAKEYCDAVKEITNGKTVVDINNAQQYYEKFSTGLTKADQAIVWPEIDENLRYFETKQDLMKYILNNQDPALNEYLESFSSRKDIQEELQQLINNHSINVDPTVTTATAFSAGTVGFLWLAWEAAEFAVMGPVSIVVP